jgi:very-short-patch-repair endonuclease
MNKKAQTDPIILERARKKRKEPTKAEKLLWQRLRRKQIGGCKFRRQHPIGRYIVDFYCHEARLIIEVDGDVHAFQEEYDADRQAALEEQGCRVVRFSNHDVLKNMDGVLEMVFELCTSSV